ncbi:hypothetical protein OCS_03376 [Ophiocordyceps sinensis CO18]|uniref:Uncharacterized protein n=1 Tax=Ophiocordyceps sinensis (strain Co18 / CGMCC 3.14243) TaxID=911162 RepID=T5AER0_OPHSC|nr:hypothetical protein OCS_03376 [Ophiocordyceps sinensis CO18]
MLGTNFKSTDLARSLKSETGTNSGKTLMTPKLERGGGKNWKKSRMKNERQKESNPSSENAGEAQQAVVIPERMDATKATTKSTAKEHAPALAILSHAVSAFDEAATSFQRAISGPPVPGVANSGAQLTGICGAKDFFRTLFLGKVTEKQHMNSAEEACWRKNHPGQASWPEELETAKAEAENAKAEKENRDGINKVLNGCATFGVAALDKITDSGIEKPCNEIFDEFQKQELLEVPGQTGNDQLLKGCWNGASDTDEKRCLEIYHDSGTCEELYKIGNCSADGQNCCKEIYEKIIKDFTSPGHNSTVFEFDAQGACKNAGEECNCTCDFERFVPTVEGPKVEG